MNKYIKKIGEIALVASLVTGSYFVGLNQNPNFDELPKKAQQAIVETHQDLDTLLTQAVDQYKVGNAGKALELYRQVEQEAELLERIDPNHEETEARIFQYGTAIIDTEKIDRYIEGFYSRTIRDTPAEFADTLCVAQRWLGDMDGHLEIIGPKSGAYHRLAGDKTAQTALLNYYVNSSLRWYNVQEQTSEMLKSSPSKSERIEYAIEILDGRMEQIQKDREWINKFKQERKLK